MVEVILYKELRLITPEAAGQHGISAEGPVFISPLVSETRVCEQCSVVYAPLVYRVKGVTMAHHFHEDSGGIYYYLHQGRNFPNQQIRHRPYWAALIDPVGENKVWDQEGGSDGILVTEIKAFHYFGFNPINKKKRIGELREGIVALSVGNPVALMPYPSGEVRKLGSLAKFSFTITEEGEIFFRDL